MKLIGLLLLLWATHNVSDVLTVASTTDCLTPIKSCKVLPCLPLAKQLRAFYSCRRKLGRILSLRGGSSTEAEFPSETPDLDESIQIDGTFNESKLVEVFNSASTCDTLEQMYNSVLARNPKHVPTLHNYGNLLMKVRHNYTMSEARYREALSVDPHHVPTLCNYGNLLHNHLSIPDQAESMYRKALDSDPVHATTLGNYGLFVQNIKKDLTVAEGWYRKALESDPHHATTLYNYGRLLQVTRALRFLFMCGRSI